MKSHKNCGLLVGAIDHYAASYRRVMAAFKLSQGYAAKRSQTSGSHTKATKARVVVPVAGAERTVEAFLPTRTTDLSSPHPCGHTLQVASIG